jgi:hypothetical protein
MGHIPTTSIQSQPAHQLLVWSRLARTIYLWSDRFLLLSAIGFKDGVNSRIFRGHSSHAMVGPSRGLEELPTNGSEFAGYGNLYVQYREGKCVNQLEAREVAVTRM